jgi:uncharacterized protein with HEPN domain
MIQHKDIIRLRHMLEHAQEAVEMAKNRSRSDLETDRTLELSLTRLVEIVGEAGARISPATQQKYPGIPWPEITGMRNRLVHGYDAVDLDILWDIIKIDFPPLIKELQRILANG